MGWVRRVVTDRRRCGVGSPTERFAEFTHHTDKQLSWRVVLRIYKANALQLVSEALPISGGGVSLNGLRCSLVDEFTGLAFLRASGRR